MVEAIPEPLRIEVSDGQSLEIEWGDGTLTRMTAPELRAFCQCAGCRELPLDQRTAEVHAAATIESAALVGSYAVSFGFGPDGHSAGIFPFIELKRYQSA
ncbi:MAG: DUF971 domain-containing protein [Acidimicrobiia bacterium]|nr:DUF971 domain-containing protein [Acidimicrobiia bacterium]